MSQLERSIKLAFDKISGEVLDIEEVCSNPKDSAEIRLRYSRNELALICCECNQELGVSKNKYDMVYFKHKSGHDDCVLTENISQQEHEEIIEFLKCKESDRHKYLKNKIGSLLQNVDEVDKPSISIDNKLVIRGNEKRRPDVYCKYKDKEIVFEIQLSKLPLSYILRRHDFYKAHNMYLLWILDNFDVHSQGTFEKDIKYLTKYQNYFRLDENNTETLYLECRYKDVFLTEENEYREAWKNKSVTLSQIKFDGDDYQIYYYNYGDNKTQAEIQQRKRTEEIKEADKRKATEQRHHNAENKANGIIRELNELRDSKERNFISAFIPISNLDEDELQVLRSRLPSVIYWLSMIDQDNAAFIDFILNLQEINLDVNAADEGDKTAFQAVYENKKIHYSSIFVKLLFKYGYKLTESDEVFFSRLSDEEREHVDISVYDFCNRLTDRTLVESVFNYIRQLWAIESAKRHVIIGFGYKSNVWVNFADNVIRGYPEQWMYIELAFKKFGLWDVLIKLDKKGTIDKKVKSFYETGLKQDPEFGKVFKDLYPELGGIEDIQ